MDRCVRVGVFETNWQDLVCHLKTRHATTKSGFISATSARFWLNGQGTQRHRKRDSSRQLKFGKTLGSSIDVGKAEDFQKRSKKRLAFSAGVTKESEMVEWSAEQVTEITQPGLQKHHRNSTRRHQSDRKRTKRILGDPTEGSGGGGVRRRVVWRRAAQGSPNQQQQPQP